MGDRDRHDRVDVFLSCCELEFHSSGGDDFGDGEGACPFII